MKTLVGAVLFLMVTPALASVTTTLAPVAKSISTAYFGAGTIADLAKANLGRKDGKMAISGKPCVLVVAYDQRAYEDAFVFVFSRPTGVSKLTMYAKPTHPLNDNWYFNFWAPNTLYWIYEPDQILPEGRQYMFEFDPATLVISSQHHLLLRDVCQFQQ